MPALDEDKPQFPRLLLCEGSADQMFLYRLIEERGLPRFHIWNAGGNRNFAGALRAYRIKRPRTLKNCSRILVVADNDEDAEGNFQNVRTQLEGTFGGGSAPGNRRERTAANPS